MFNLFNEIDLVQDLRALADKIEENDRLKMIALTYKGATGYIPKDCNCEKGAERYKCKKCNGTGIILVKESSDRNEN